MKSRFSSQHETGDDAMAPEPIADISPDDATVEQAEYPHGVMTTLPVCVEGPVQTQALPTQGSGSRRVTLSTTQPQRLLGKDPRRARATIQVYDASGATHGIFHGPTQNEVNPPSSYAARLGVTLPAGGIPVASAILTVTSREELWAVADTAACEVSVVSEQWAY